MRLKSICFFVSCFFYMINTAYAAKSSVSSEPGKESLALAVFSEDEQALDLVFLKQEKKGKRVTYKVNVYSHKLEGSSFHGKELVDMVVGCTGMYVTFKYNVSDVESKQGFGEVVFDPKTKMAPELCFRDRVENIELDDSLKAATIVFHDKTLGTIQLPIQKQRVLNRWLVDDELKKTYAKEIAAVKKHLKNLPKYDPQRRKIERALEASSHQIAPSGILQYAVSPKAGSEEKVPKFTSDVSSSSGEREEEKKNIFDSFSKDKNQKRKLEEKSKDQEPDSTETETEEGEAAVKRVKTE